MPVFQDSAGVAVSLHSLKLAIWPSTPVVILIDDGSDPPLRVEPEAWSPLRIRAERLPENSGIEVALNAAIAVARELGITYVARLDAGDTIDEQRLCKQFAVLDAAREVGIVGSDVNFFSEDGDFLFRFEAPRSDGEIRRRMHINSCLLHPAVMIRMSVIEMVGPYSPRYQAAEDYDLFFRILGASKGASIPEPLTRKVVARHSISVKRRRTQLVSRLRVQMRNFDPGLIESFLGVAMTLTLFAIPNSVILKLKRRSGRFVY